MSNGKLHLWDIERWRLTGYDFITTYGYGRTYLSRSLIYNKYHSTQTGVATHQKPTGGVFTPLTLSEELLYYAKV